ncbi:hypothetical protein BB561_003040 [Smittium simulii]|uniref:Uncharacterized protein n=1 Tax=Smittium simulii TaxID=133385 RepID=A0A2T9YNA5_9FUNG|nr:hypothetical protein BB561_003040 [Smittium simulii]
MIKQYSSLHFLLNFIVFLSVIVHSSPIQINKKHQKQTCLDGSKFYDSISKYSSNNNIQHLAISDNLDNKNSCSENILQKRVGGQTEDSSDLSLSSLGKGNLADGEILEKANIFSRPVKMVEPIDGLRLPPNPLSQSSSYQLNIPNPLKTPDILESLSSKGGIGKHSYLESEDSSNNLKFPTTSGYKNILDGESSAKIPKIETPEKSDYSSNYPETPKTPDGSRVSESDFVEYRPPSRSLGDFDSASEHTFSESGSRPSTPGIPNTPGSPDFPNSPKTPEFPNVSDFLDSESTHSSYGGSVNSGSPTNSNARSPTSGNRIIPEAEASDSDSFIETSRLSPKPANTGSIARKIGSNIPNAAENAELVSNMIAPQVAPQVVSNVAASSGFFANFLPNLVAVIFDTKDKSNVSSESLIPTAGLKLSLEMQLCTEAGIAVIDIMSSFKQVPLIENKKNSMPVLDTGGTPIFEQNQRLLILSKHFEGLAEDSTGNSRVITKWQNIWEPSRDTLPECNDSIT